VALALDCCSPLQLSDPQPAVDHLSFIHRDSMPTVWQQAAETKAAAGCSSPGKSSFNAELIVLPAEPEFIRLEPNL
jgi:hypothetical protein